MIWGYHYFRKAPHIQYSKCFDLIPTLPWVQCIGRWTLHFLGWPHRTAVQAVQGDPSSPAAIPNDSEIFQPVIGWWSMVITAGLVGFLEFCRNPFWNEYWEYEYFSSHSVQALAGFASHILLHLLYQMNSFLLIVIYQDEIQCMFLVWLLLKLQQNSWPTNRTFSVCSLPSNTKDAPTVGTSAMILKNWMLCCGCW